MEGIKRDSFVLFRSFRDAVKAFPYEIKGILYDAIADYALDGIEPNFSDATEFAIWTLLKPQIDANIRKYLNGKKGGNPNFRRGQTNPYKKSKSNNQPITTQQAEDNQEITTKQPPNNQPITTQQAKCKMINGKWEMGNGKCREVEDSSSLCSETTSTSELPLVANAPNGSSEAKTSDPASCSENTSIVLSGTKKKEFDFTEFAKFFNKTMDEANATISRVKKITGRRMDYIKARIREFSEEELHTVVRKAAVSDFLNGRNDRGWKADFTWLFLPNNFPKILEGNYDNDNRRNNQAGRPGATWPGGNGYGTKAEFNAEALRRTEASILRTLQGVEDPKPNF